LKVITRSPKIDKIRKTVLELAAVSAGEDAGKLRTLASEYNADLSRFKSRVPMRPKKCILCGLCVRRCAEANWDSAIGFIGRGINRRVVIFPEKEGICSNCNYCYVVCPTGRITSTYIDPPFPHVDDVLAGRK
jgi:bidirectional [NiFe] hydrogenase diaphorase subunit